jgi:pimeloyl-ACP methyl ester carboxylesterase
MKIRHISFLLALLIASTGLALADAPEEHFFDSDGVKIRYIVSGEGEPVLLIHGYTASAETNWGSVIPALSKKYKVIALDNRGHGKSGKPAGADQYDEEMVTDSINLLDHLGIEKAHVVGYSMGGYITAKMTTMYPERMLSATIGGAGWAQDDPARNSMLELLAKSIEEEGSMAPLFTALTPEGETMPEAQINAMSSMIMQNNDPKALANVARGMKGHAVAKDDLEKVDLPTMLIIGSKDPLKNSADAWMSIQDDDKYVVLEGADHMTAFTNPKFLASIEAFLAANSTE